MPTPAKHRKPNRTCPPGTGGLYWSFAIWTVAIGFLLIFAPKNWFGPTWSFFPQLPHNGFGFGLCCVLLGTAQLWALRYNATARTFAILNLLIGFVYWTSAMILGAEGLLGHKGLMEAPFILYQGAQAYAQGLVLMVFHQRNSRK